MTGTVNFVFCIDAEGPLYESTQACFERLRGLFGVKLPPPTEENLRLLQEGKIKLGGREKEVMQVVSPSVRDWLGNWKDVLENVRHTSAPEFRRQVLDDVGRGLVFNWFVCDWTEGFRHNPRRKPIGINLVFSHYHELFAKDPANNPLYFHHHCAPLSGCTHHPCKNWSTIPAHLAVISARLIEYGHFASCLRSPIMAPDIHLFAEQFFPFDMSNTAVPNDGQPDVMSRRWTDWEGAPADWSVYHPDFHDYRKPGALKRAIGRSMQCGSRYGNITEKDLREAFVAARSGKSQLVSCHLHDQSPIRKCAGFFELLNKVRRDYPDVPFRNASTVEAFRDMLGIKPRPAPSFEVELKGTHFLCRSDREIFGSQPWLCFKTRDGQYHWDNMDCMEERSWRYIFDQYTCPLEMLDAIGVGANDAAGQAVTAVYGVPEKALRNGGK